MMNSISLNIVSPCKDCQNRELHCHSTCEEYKHYKAAIEESREEKRTEREANSFIYETKNEIRKRYNRRRSCDKKVRFK